MIETALKLDGIEARVDPSKLIPNQGYWRIDFRADVMPWGGGFEMMAHGDWRKAQVESWDTMSDLVRGFTMGWDRYLALELYADQPKPHPTLTRIKAAVAAQKTR